jgi:hypothetical protein
MIDDPVLRDRAPRGAAAFDLAAFDGLRHSGWSTAIGIYSQSLRAICTGAALSIMSMF